MIPESAVTVSRDNQRSRWIKLRTTILLRWVAILGQSAAVLVAVQFYNLRLELELIIFAIGISVAGNLVAMFVFPKNERLSEKQNTAMILFDLLQLLLLLFFYWWAQQSICSFSNRPCCYFSDLIAREVYTFPWCDSNSRSDLTD
jgi:uncharacterized integral membrane protein